MENLWLIWRPPYFKWRPRNLEYSGYLWKAAPVRCSSPGGAPPLESYWNTSPDIYTVVVIKREFRKVRTSSTWWIASHNQAYFCIWLVAVSRTVHCGVHVYLIMEAARLRPGLNPLDLCSRPITQFMLNFYLLKMRFLCLISILIKEKDLSIWSIYSTKRFTRTFLIRFILVRNSHNLFASSCLWIVFVS